MALTTWLLLLGTCSHVVFGRTLMCYECHDIKNPDECRYIQRCHPNQICVTTVNEVAPNDFYYTMRCGDDHEHCYTQEHLVGKRQHHAGPDHGHDAGHHHQHNLRCEKCCDDKDLCNKGLCAQYHMGTGQPVITTNPSGPSVTPIPVTSSPVYDPHCRNHEEDGFSCAAFDLFHFCHDPSSFAYVLAHEKCRAHCGFCTAGSGSQSVTTVPVTSPPSGVCADYEQDGFKCVSFDLFHFCNDTSSIAYVVSHEKCRKHCGHCKPDNSGAGSSQTTPAPTSQTVAFTTAMPQTTTGAKATTTIMAALTTTSGPIFTATAPQTCSDIEDNGFSCAYMDSFSICTTTDPVMVTVKNEKCKKHCGLCH